MLYATLLFMETITISKSTVRRFVLGRQGLWPGRRWEGLEGTAEALYALEEVQMDPLNIVARSHEIVLWSRVSGYRPAYLDQLLYERHQFFDYGGCLCIYPMTELPYWRLHMRHREGGKRWAEFVATNQTLLEEVRTQLRLRGPLGNRDFVGQERVTHYRGSKGTALALYYLWLTGELLIHHRQGFERVYDFRERVVPPALNYVATEEETERYFARKAVAHKGLIREREWANGLAGYVGRRVERTEAKRWTQSMVERGELAAVQVEGSRDLWFVLSTDVPLLSALEAGEVPDSWRPLATTTEEEAVLLAPLDIVSTRGRATWLFDFEYLWEVYKPAMKRRWGYYTLPILYGDRLVARLDAKFDRPNSTLVINGFWLEEHAPVESTAFAAALARGLARFAEFVEAERVNMSAVEPVKLREEVQAQLRHL